MFTEPEVNNCFSIIFRGEYQGVENNRLMYKDTDAIIIIIVCLLTGMYSRTFNNKLTCTLIVNQFANTFNGW